MFSIQPIAVWTLRDHHPSHIQIKLFNFVCCLVIFRKLLTNSLNEVQEPVGYGRIVFQKVFVSQCKMKY